MDRTLILIQLLLGAFGILGVATGEPSAAFEHGTRFLACFGLTLFVGRLKPRAIVRLSPIAYFVVLGLLILVLIIGVSPAGSESKRWLLIGNLSLQPSELMKVTVVAYLAAFFYNHLGNWELWRPIVVIGIAAALIVVEPDVSTAAFLFALAFGIMIAAGTSFGRLLAISAAALAVAALLAGTYLAQFNYLGDRVSGFFDLRGEQTATATTSYQGWRAQQVLVSAGVFGTGPGRPNRVPEAETDMVSVAVTQSLGLIGVIFVITLYVLLGLRGMRISAALQGPGSLLAAGATIYICGQAALNLLVASGLFPITGIPLPLMSYGLNSLISISVALGFIHSAYRQVRLEAGEAA